MKLKFAIIALLVFSSFAAACAQDSDCTQDQVCACGDCVVRSGWYAAQYHCISGTWGTWGPIAMVGVIISFLIVAVAYMFALGFDLPELKMWAKTEFYQALASALLVAGLLWLTWAMLDEGAAKILGGSVNPFNLADNYLADLGATLHATYREFYLNNYFAEAATTLTIYQNAANLELNILIFLKPIVVEPYHLAAYYVVQFLIIISFWQGLLFFFKESAFAVFLPLGVFLRIFQPTRGAGGVLIAIAIGFFVVFPTFFGFIMMMSEDENALAQQVAGAQSVGIDLEDFNACEFSMESIVQSAEGQTDPAILAEINTYYSFIGPIWLKIFFYPIVVMAVTITFIKTLAPLLGSDISEIGQGLVKLI